MRLGTQILTRLKHINQSNSQSVQIPSFDKSLFSGEGDRADTWISVNSPVDVVILEGWCVGFYPTTQEEIDRRWVLPVQGLREDFFGKRGFRKEDVVEINEKLKEYLQWWKFFDVFIQARACHMSIMALAKRQMDDDRSSRRKGIRTTLYTGGGCNKSIT